MPRKILLATPCRDSVTLHYLSGITELLAKGNDMDIEFIPSVARSTYVNCARNDAVALARAKECHEVVFVDADIGWSAAQLLRLCSHEVDVVGGVYAKRKSGTPEWTAHAKEGSLADENGLQECNDLPAGFLRVKMSVFDRIEALNPWRRYQHKGEDVAKCEFFPIGLVGDGTPEATLQAILAVLRHYDASWTPFHIRAEIEAIIAKETAPHNRSLLGEDTYFCRLCREAGVKLYADVRLVLPHYGEIAFPAKTL